MANKKGRTKRTFDMKDFQIHLSERKCPMTSCPIVAGREIELWPNIIKFTFLINIYGFSFFETSLNRFKRVCTGLNGTKKIFEIFEQWILTIKGWNFQFGQSDARNWQFRRFLKLHFCDMLLYLSQDLSHNFCHK